MHQPIPFDAILVITALPVRAAPVTRAIKARLARRLLAGHRSARCPRKYRAGSS